MHLYKTLYFCELCELNHPVFINVCQSNVSGEFTRKCSVEGTNWLLPVDNCVQDRLKTIKEQVK